MKSPFPGMDPFIEGCSLWEDFHSHLVEAVYVFLADNVPSKYVVRTGERNYVVLENADGQRNHPFLPDVSVISNRGDLQCGANATALAETETESPPLSMRAFIEEVFRETFIEIHEADPEGRLVTCIEVLSPSNKKPHSEGWEIYLRKRQGLLLGRSANLVEIDLLRGGQRLPMLDPWPASPYTLLVARRNWAPSCSVWPAHFRNRLPSIPVPLLKPDPDVKLDLQPMIDSIYARSRYHRSIDYSRPLTPPLAADELTWLGQQRKVT